MKLLLVASIFSTILVNSSTISQDGNAVKDTEIFVNKADLSGLDLVLSSAAAQLFGTTVVPLFRLTSFFYKTTTQILYNLLFFNAQPDAPAPFYEVVRETINSFADSTGMITSAVEIDEFINRLSNNLKIKSPLEFEKIARLKKDIKSILVHYPLVTCGSYLEYLSRVLNTFQTKINNGTPTQEYPPMTIPLRGSITSPLNIDLYGDNGVTEHAIKHPNFWQFNKYGYTGGLNNGIWNIPSYIENRIKDFAHHSHILNWVDNITPDPIFNINHTTKPVNATTTIPVTTVPATTASTNTTNTTALPAAVPFPQEPCQQFSCEDTPLVIPTYGPFDYSVVNPVINSNVEISEDVFNYDISYDVPKQQNSASISYTYIPNDSDNTVNDVYYASVNSNLVIPEESTNYEDKSQKPITKNDPKKGMSAPYVTMKTGMEPIFNPAYSGMNVLGALSNIKSNIKDAINGVNPYKLLSNDQKNTENFVWSTPDASIFLVQKLEALKPSYMSSVEFLKRISDLIKSAKKTITPSEFIMLITSRIPNPELSESARASFSSYIGNLFEGPFSSFDQVLKHIYEVIDKKLPLISNYGGVVVEH